MFYKIIEHKSEGMIKKIEEYVDMHLTEKITVKSLSEYLGVSRTTIYILIKKQFGKSIIEYINFKKMEKAKYLLSQGKTTSKVVEELGIYDSNYYFRLFKKFNGITLGEFKRQLHE